MNELILQFNNPLLEVLLLSIGFDIILGTLVAFCKHKANSRINKNGITKHITIVLIVTFCMFIFKPLKMNTLINSIILFYIASYVLSIIENSSLLGVPIPKWLTNRFTMLQEENNEIKRIKK